MDKRKSSPETILLEMDKLLDALIGGAEKLLELSGHVVDEEGLLRLQDRQDELLSQLLEKDKELHHFKDLSVPKIQSLRNEIDRKIDLFQKLNNDFVEKISAVQGLIHFDSTGVKKKVKYK